MKVPKNVSLYYQCLLLHKKTPYWDGTYIKNDEDRFVEKIIWICNECTPKFHESAKEKNDNADDSESAIVAADAL
jgi:ribosomal protein L37AE/L43A